MLECGHILFPYMRSLRRYNGRLIKTKKVILCFRTRLVLGLIYWLSCSLVGHNAHGFLGDVVEQYSFPASSFAMSPTQPLMYATIPSQNSVAIINTNTLAVEDTVFVGSRPVNLAFSPNGLKAYIANSASNFVVVLDTQSRTVVNSFLLPQHPQDVVFGNQNRLWVLGEDQIYQIDATTGASTGPSGGFNGGVFVYSGSLEISSDGNTLYYGDYGLSPSTMYKINVSGAAPVLVRETPFGTGGENGQDLALSHSGNFICYATGAGQNNYDIAKFRTSDFASTGSFDRPVRDRLLLARTIEWSTRSTPRTKSMSLTQTGSSLAPLKVQARQAN